MIKKLRKMWFVVLITIIIEVVSPSYSYAVSGSTIHSVGGKLLAPVMEAFVALSDGVIDITQKVLFGVDGDAIVEVDREGSWISKAIGVIAGIAVLAGCIALAVITAPVTGIAATIAVGIGTAILSVGKVIKTYFITSVLVSSMLGSTFQLPFIVISPETIIQNKIGMFNVNFFSANKNISTEDNSINIADELHIIIAKWYYAIRNIVIILFMILLLYTGIRILITSISEEKAKYKKMLVDWFISFCLVFVIHYIMIFSMNIVDEFTKLISTINNDESVEYYEIVDDKVYDYVKENLVDPDEKPSWFSEKVSQIKSTWGANGNTGEYSTLYINEEGKKAVRYPVDNFISQARINAQLLDRDSSTETYVSVGWRLIYVMLTILVIRFGWIYLKRVIYIAFLIIIAPVVILTYSIDRFKDGQAQGFNTWIREYLFNLAIQPFHLILYTVFVGTAMSLASKSPIYVLVVLGFMSQAETILRKMFGFQKATTPGVLSGAFGTGVAMSGLQKVFGKKPPQVSTNLNKIEQKETNAKSRIKEQNNDDEIELDTDNVEEIQNEKESAEETFKIINYNADFEKNDMEEVDAKDDKKIDTEVNDTKNDRKIDIDVNDITNDKKIDANENKMKRQKRMEMAVNNIRMEKNSKPNQNPSSKSKLKPNIPIEITNKNTKRKAKFKLGKAIKGTARKYVNAKGKALANRTMNTDFIGGAKRAIFGGAAAFTAGTAGVILGAMDGSPEKAARNAVIAGTASYKGVSNIITANKTQGITETFKKSGYGDEYSKYKDELLAKEIKHDLEKKNELIEEFSWNKDELNKFLKQTVDQYIDAGVKEFDDMVIGEKLKINGVAKNTKEAIGIMAMGQKIGTDTTKLTEKKKQEWAETFMEKNVTMSKIKKDIGQKENEYNEKRKQVIQQKLDKNEEKRQIKQIEFQRNNDPELNKLKKSTEIFQVRVFDKLDKYSEYKYKG